MEHDDRSYEHRQCGLYAKVTSLEILPASEGMNSPLPPVQSVGNLQPDLTRFTAPPWPPFGGRGTLFSKLLLFEVDDPCEGIGLQ